MFDEYTAMTNYMTYDNSSLNQYSYKNLNDNFPIYQQYENIYQTCAFPVRPGNVV